MVVFVFALQVLCSGFCECGCVVTEWKPEHFSDVAVLLSKCEDVYSADVPSSLQVSSLLG